MNLWLKDAVASAVAKELSELQDSLQIIFHLMSGKQIDKATKKVHKNTQTTLFCLTFILGN